MLLTAEPHCCTRAGYLDVEGNLDPEFASDAVRNLHHITIFNLHKHAFGQELMQSTAVPLGATISNALFEDSDQEVLLALN